MKIVGKRNTMAAMFTYNWKSIPFKFAAQALIAALFFGLWPTPAGAQALRLVADANISADTVIDETSFNGLSGLFFDERRDLFYVVSDDRATHDHARFYTLAMTTDNGRLHITDGAVTFLTNHDGSHFPPGTIDFEGITMLANGNLLISGEGNRNRAIDPAIREFTIDGRLVRTWPLPGQFLGKNTDNRGVRNNLGFESLTATPDRRRIFATTEQALIQDGDISGIDRGSVVRIITYNQHATPIAQYLYQVEPWPAPDGLPRLIGGNGLVELLALDEFHLLALERAYLKSLDRNIIRLFMVDLTEAQDVSHIDSLANHDSPLSYANKQLILDFDEILPELSPGFQSLDNIEGVSFGPPLASGNGSLIFVSDGNFNPPQRTQFLVFELLP
jgi:hypothetical protein